MRTHTVIGTLAIALLTAGCGSHSTPEPTTSPTPRPAHTTPAATTPAARALDLPALEACRDIAAAQQATTSSATQQPESRLATLQAENQLLTLVIRAGGSAMRSQTPGFARAWAGLVNIDTRTPQGLQARRLLCEEYGWTPDPT